MASRPVQANVLTVLFVYGVSILSHDASLGIDTLSLIQDCEYNGLSTKVNPIRHHTMLIGLTLITRESTPGKDCGSEYHFNLH